MMYGQEIKALFRLGLPFLCLARCHGDGANHGLLCMIYRRGNTLCKSQLVIWGEIYYLCENRVDFIMLTKLT